MLPQAVSHLLPLVLVRERGRGGRLRTPCTLMHSLQLDGRAKRQPPPLPSPVNQPPLACGVVAHPRAPASASAASSPPQCGRSFSNPLLSPAPPRLRLPPGELILRRVTSAARLGGARRADARGWGVGGGDAPATRPPAGSLPSQARFRALQASADETMSRLGLLALLLAVSAGTGAPSRRLARPGAAQPWGGDAHWALGLLARGGRSPSPPSTLPARARRVARRGGCCRRRADAELCGGRAAAGAQAGQDPSAAGPAPVPAPAAAGAAGPAGAGGARCGRGPRVCCAAFCARRCATRSHPVLPAAVIGAVQSRPRGQTCCLMTWRRPILRPAASRGQPRAGQQVSETAGCCGGARA